NENSTFLRLKDAMTENIDWENKCYPASKKDKLTEAISFGNFCIAEGERSKGVGQQLIQHAETLATRRGCDRMEVHCHQSR
ncbi:GNAT family N-acetyltransferase, partial [Pantoea agglomerans]|uniref:GNAT family N-acetyltransferase n=1 Tax=Enterobacter agglomerans TaxID=549 RepID=UPI001F5D99A0